MQMKHLFVAAIALLTAACLPVTSKAPVGNAGADAGLAGTWKAVLTDNKATAWFHFLPQKDGSLTVLIVASKNKNDDASWTQFKVRTAQLGELHYINAVEVADDGKPATGHTATDNIPLFYRYTGTRKLTLYLIDEKKAADAVRSKKISGTVEKGDFGDVHFTADAAEQNKFFASKDGAALFTTSFAVLTKAD